ncbi:MAG: DUF1573 domain-containing protein [Verrucomicrobia bacterium]|jgi:mono/diheme cytochrome c family protein|nr:DUF1573 domain-containing protein [Verrucomicrobiota bacterium]
MRSHLIMLLILIDSALRCLPVNADLVWESSHLTKVAKHDEESIRFVFPFSNSDSKPITIQTIDASCGCTQANPPVLPWVIEGGTHQELEIIVHIQGKTGQFTKSLNVVSSEGSKELTTSVEIENPVFREMKADERERNLVQSKSDRQAIFKGECGSCHAEPTKGKYGPSLYDAACGICHDAKHRASMVPDLKPKIKTEGADYWRQWITHGKKEGLMPGFAASEKGPLSGSQISTLIHFLAKPESKTESKTGKGVIRSFGVPRSNPSK